jgi:predicted enzyme related to lactoylglutathione lyase
VAIVLAAAPSESEAGGGMLYLETDDFHADYESLKGRGVEIQPPNEQPYGIDAGFNDPSGNYVKLTEGR